MGSFNIDVKNKSLETCFFECTKLILYYILAFILINDKLSKLQRKPKC